MSDPVPVPTPTSATNDHWLPNKMYDVLKFLAQIFFPAVAALYYGLSGIWGFPDAEEVIGTIAIVDTFLGVFLSITKAQFLASDSAYDGAINVATPADGPKTFSLELNSDPTSLDQKKAVTFKVNAS